jgi:hypothetical protein
MMNFAFLPEFAAAAIGLAAVRLGSRIQSLSQQRGRCREPHRKTVVWAYNPFNAKQRGQTQAESWTAVRRDRGC